MEQKLQLVLKSLGMMVIAVICLTTNTLHAETFDYLDLPPEELLEAEIISASRRTEKLSEIPSAVYVISHEDIRQSGVTSIPDALRMAPGVHVAQADANSWAISIRGFNGILANKLLVMIDGRTVYNPLFAGTYWEVQDLVLADIDRIEVIRGPGGALWGANAVNGVINIITKHTAYTQGTMVTGSVGTHQYRSGAVRYGGAVGEDLFYRIYSKYSNHGSFKTPSGADSNDDWESYQAGFRADWGNEITLQGGLLRVNTDQLNSTPIVTAPYALEERETMESYNAYLLGRWEKALEDGGLLSLQSYLDYFEREQIALDDKRFIFDIDSQYNFPRHGRHELTAGLGYRIIADDLTNTSTVVFDPANRTDQLFSAFLQDQILLKPKKWHLTLGSKFEYNDYSGFEFQPNARLMWHPQPDKSVWAAISRAVRTPSRLEHDLTQTLGVFAPGALLAGLSEAVLEPNPDMGPEKLTAYELGYRQQINPRLFVDIASFYNVYDDLATFSFLPLRAATTGPARTIFPVSYVNALSAETYGIEISGEWQATDNWKLETNLSAMDMQLHLDEGNSFNQEAAEGQSYDYQIYLGSVWDINKSWSLNSGLYYYDELDAYAVSDYLRLDINLEWRPQENLRFNLVGQNLLDDRHREFSSPTSLNATEIESSIYGKFTWEF